MPRKDKTGPRGDGPLTGRGLGPCYTDGDYRDRRSVSRGLGRGSGRWFGPGRGPGRGFGRGYGADGTGPRTRRESIEEERNSKR